MKNLYRSRDGELYEHSFSKRLLFTNVDQNCDRCSLNNNPWDCHHAPKYILLDGVTITCEHKRYNPNKPDSLKNSLIVWTIIASTLLFLLAVALTVPTDGLF